MPRPRHKSQKRKRPNKTQQMIVSTEGSETEPQYFYALKSEFRLGNVILLKSKTRSSPRQVLKRLDKEKRKVRQTREVNAETQFWAVFDHDNLTQESLEEILSEARQKGYRVADSSPCFELWLLMRFGKLADFKGLEGQALTHGCSGVARELATHDKTYDSGSKGRYDASAYIRHLQIMIENARAVDSQPDSVWLNQIGSRVYKLVESIINSST